MIYEYGCDRCLKVVEIVKSHTLSDVKERCETCTEFMIRIYSPPQISVAKLEPHFNHAFGKVIHSKEHLKEHIKKENGDKGKNIVEVGNDPLSSIKKTRKEYTID